MIMFKDIIRQIKKNEHKLPVFSYRGNFELRHLHGTYKDRKPASIGGPLDMKISILESAVYRSPQAVHDLLQQFGLRIINSTQPPFFDLVEQEG